MNSVSLGPATIQPYFSSGYPAFDPRVKALQQELARAGIDTGPVDGILGEKTLSAVFRGLELLGGPRGASLGASLPSLADDAAWLEPLLRRSGITPEMLRSSVQAARDRASWNTDLGMNGRLPSSITTDPSAMVSAQNLLAARNASTMFGDPRTDPLSSIGTLRGANMSPYGLASSIPGLTPSIPGLIPPTPGLMPTLPGSPASFPGVYPVGTSSLRPDGVSSTFTNPYAHNQAAQDDAVGSLALKGGRWGYNALGRQVAGRAYLDAMGRLPGATVAHGGASGLATLNRATSLGGDVVQNSTKALTRSMVEGTEAASRLPGWVTNNGTTRKFLEKTITRAAQNEGGHAALRTVAAHGLEVAAEKGVPRVLTRVGAQAAGRFVPALNIGIAALDTKQMVDVCSDPRASLWKKGGSVVTAGASWVAASNIPIVSQVGAGVSLVSGLFTAFV